LQGQGLFLSVLRLNPCPVENQGSLFFLWLF
jgi:hypothetical protein